MLDQRSLRTPAKAPLIVPTISLAREIAREWDAQVSEIDPNTMPFTKTANAAIDKVAVQKAEVAGLLAAYGDSDLLCYRAEFPDALVERQNVAWDPLLDWAERELGVKLLKHSGVIHHPQNPKDLARLAGLVLDLDDFELAAFHDLVSISGSLIIGFSALKEPQTAEYLWNTSQTDERWQIEHWGEDQEAQEFSNQKCSAFLHAAAFIQHCNGER